MEMNKKVLIGFLSVILVLPLSVFGEAQIFMYRNKDGSILFSTRKVGDKPAQVITAKSSSSLSYYRSSIDINVKPMNTAVFNELFQEAAKETGVEVGLIKAVIHAESAFNPRAVSPKGAKGIMQLMSVTAKDLGVSTLFHPGSNIKAGSRYLAQLLKRYGGNTVYALAAYNAGPEAVEKYKGIPPYSETKNYVKRVLRLKNRYASVTNG